MASIKIASSTVIWGTCGALAVFLALGFLLLALEGRIAKPATSPGSVQQPAASTTPLTASGLHPHPELPLLLPPWGAASAHRPPATTSGDNWAVLALSGSAALAVAGLAFGFTRRPRRVALVGVVSRNGYRRRAVHGAPSR